MLLGLSFSHLKQVKEITIVSSLALRQEKQKWVWQILALLCVLQKLVGLRILYEKEQAFQHMPQQPISTHLYCPKKSAQNITGI